jgi:3-isopropylmalate/(R)-2-methylmalate dehydratase small subunit
MQAMRQLNSRTVVLPVNDVDTDQIIPARFLTTTTREGLASTFPRLALLDDGANRIRSNRAASGCEILVAGRNWLRIVARTCAMACSTLASKP